MISVLLYSILGIILSLLICRYVPGFKCISYCKYKTYVAKIYKNKLYNMCEFQNYRHGSAPLKVTTINTDGYSSKQLLKIYNNSGTFSCREFSIESWIPEARELLKERIAELQILES